MEKDNFYDNDVDYDAYNDFQEWYLGQWRNLWPQLCLLIV